MSATIDLRPASAILVFAMGSYLVMPTNPGGWIVRRYDQPEPEAEFAAPSQALEYARQIASDESVSEVR